MNIAEIHNLIIRVENKNKSNLSRVARLSHSYLQKRVQVDKKIELDNITIAK